MAESERLTGAERGAALAPLLQSGWQEVAGRDAIRKAFAFRDFADAFGFMTRAAIWAEKWNHHPEWSNIYRKVTVVLSTHDAGGLTARDIRLAAKLDELAGG